MATDDLKPVTTTMGEGRSFFQKEKIENVIADFEKEGYSAEFLEDLKNGLKKSSIYSEL